MAFCSGEPERALFFATVRWGEFGETTQIRCCIDEEDLEAMKHRYARAAFATLALTTLTGLSARAQNPTLYRPVLFFYSGSNLPGIPSQARLDGSGAQTLAAIPGNLSWSVAPAPRYFLKAEARPGSNLNDLVTYDESATVRTVLSGAQDINYTAAVWSKDSQRVAYYGKRVDVLGNVLESGLFVGDIVTVGGVPVGVTNEHLVAPDTAATLDAQGNVTTFSFYLWDWMFPGAGVSTRLTYTVQAVTRTPAGAFVAKRFDLFVAQVGAPGTAGTAASVRLNINNLPPTNGSARFLALASPVDDRIAIGTLNATSSSPSRYDLFVANVPAAYAGASFTAVQITNSRNASSTVSMQNIGWSQDGGYVYWDGAGAVVGVYRIASGGTGAQVSIIAPKKGYNTLGQIRP